MTDIEKALTVALWGMRLDPDASRLASKLAAAPQMQTIALQAAIGEAVLAVPTGMSITRTGQGWAAHSPYGLLGVAYDEDLPAAIAAALGEDR